MGVLARESSAMGGKKLEEIRFIAGLKFKKESGLIVSRRSGY
jgi:hypothetical protein